MGVVWLGCLVVVFGFMSDVCTDNVCVCVVLTDNFCCFLSSVLFEMYIDALHVCCCFNWPN